MFGFEVKIMDICCVCSKQPWIRSRLLCESTHCVKHFYLPQKRQPITINLLTQLATDKFSSPNELKSVYWGIKDLSEQPKIFFAFKILIFFINPLSFRFVYFQSLLHNMGSICLLNLKANIYANRHMYYVISQHTIPNHGEDHHIFYQ